MAESHWRGGFARRWLKELEAKGTFKEALFEAQETPWTNGSSHPDTEREQH